MPPKKAAKKGAAAKGKFYHVDKHSVWVIYHIL